MTPIINGLSQLIAGASLLAIGLPLAATGSEPGELQITHTAGELPVLGSADNFTGNARITPLFQPTEHRRAGGASVTFAPGARTVWHSHPGGQTLIVTAGSGWVQRWGGEKQLLRVGDVVWTPPGVKHWHGATEGESMTHLAFQEQVGRVVVKWLEPVTDDVYRQRPAEPKSP